MHRESHHLNLWVQGKFDSGVPGGSTLLLSSFSLTSATSSYEEKAKETITRFAEASPKKFAYQ